MITLVLLLAFIGFILYGCNIRSRWKHRTLPGPKPQLFFGAFVSFKISSLDSNPYKSFLIHHKYTPFWPKCASTDLPLLTSYPLNLKFLLNTTGNMLQLGKPGSTQRTYNEWAKTFGDIYVFYLGRNPCIVLSDPELIREVALKKFTAFHDRCPPLLVPGSASDARFISDGMLFARSVVNLYFLSIIIQKFLFLFITST